jgi:hypothetical protein
MYTQNRQLTTTKGEIIIFYVPSDTTESIDTNIDRHDADETS